MNHKIEVDIDVRTVDERGQPISLIEPSYLDAFELAQQKCLEEARWLGIWLLSPPNEVESELVNVDDPRATLRFTFRVPSSP